MPATPEGGRGLAGRGRGLAGEHPQGQGSAGRTPSGLHVTRMCRVLTAGCQQPPPSARSRFSSWGWAQAHLATSLPSGRLRAPRSLNSAGIFGAPATGRYCITCSGFSGEPERPRDWQRAWRGSQTRKEATPAPSSSLSFGKSGNPRHEDGPPLSSPREHVPGDGRKVARKPGLT